MLQKRPVPTVDVTIPVLPEMLLVSMSVRLWSMPLPVRSPPKVTEQMIRKMVLSIPVIPLVEIRESSSGLPVDMPVGP